jgi:hypothetical protein
MRYFFAAGLMVLLISSVHAQTCTRENITPELIKQSAENFVAADKALKDGPKQGEEYFSNFHARRKTLSIALVCSAIADQLKQEELDKAAAVVAQMKSNPR